MSKSRGARNTGTHDSPQTTKRVNASVEQAVRLTADRIIRRLKTMGSREVRDGMIRFGIPSDCAYGIAMPELKAFAKEIGKSQALAEELYASTNYEARTLAAFVADSKEIPGAVMDEWASRFDSWAICDTHCIHLFKRTPHAWEKVQEWARAEPEFLKRAAFATLASVAVHDKKAGDARYLEALTYIKHASNDERNFVRKAVDWALRSIGKRNLSLNHAARECARDLIESGDKNAQWIGRTALRELESQKIHTRLRKRA